MTKLGKISASAALMVGLAAPAAFAGPQMTFGPEDQGILQLDYKGQFQLSVRDTGSGANNNATTTNFNFRRNRLALMGAYGDMFSMYVQTEFSDQQSMDTLSVRQHTSDPKFSMLDAVFRFNLHDAFKVNAGKFKYSFTRENLEACEMPLTLDRSLFLTAPLMGNNPTRDMGVGIWGNLFEDKFQYRFDVMEGRKATTGEVAPKSNFRYSGRMHVSLLDPESDYGYKGTYLGKKKVLTVGGAMQYEPDAVYSDVANKAGKKDYYAWTVDGFFEYPVKDVGTFTASGAYVRYKMDNAYNNINADTASYGLNGEKNGWYAKAGYMLPNLPLQFFGRYEQWKFANLNYVYNQKVDWAGIGANYYIWGQNLKLTMEYGMTRFDTKGTHTNLAGDKSENTKNFNTFITQLQVIF
ncbi:MAG: selenite/tellurite reduction operon porin ExtI [Trichlorobacter sp.]|nr:selenite/tellurite reduction operon porin ExtI [Trichlorobacter sp.]